MRVEALLSTGSAQNLELTGNMEIEKEVKKVRIPRRCGEAGRWTRIQAAFQLVWGFCSETVLFLI